MRPALSAARAALRTPLFARTAAATPAVRSAPAPSAALAHLHRARIATQQQARSLTTSRPVRSRYEHFDTPSWGQPNNGPQNVHNFLRRRLGGDGGVIIFGLAVGGGVIYYIAHLERVPATGRLRFMDCSKEMENEMGQESFAETMQQFGGQILPPNHPVSKRVRQVAARIIERNGLGVMKTGHTLGTLEGMVGSWGLGGDGNSAIDPPDQNTEWEVYVVNDPKTKNAFVIPGGKIFVFTGILPVSANDDGLATVLGHEVAHVVARHGAERMSYMKVLFGISFLLEMLGLDVGISRMLVTFSLQLPNSRTNETEADTIGLQLMARACYNPSESTHMWERMSEGEGMGGNFDFMSTHPANAKRIKALGKQVAAADHIRDESCSNTGQQNQAFKDQVGNWSTSWA